MNTNWQEIIATEDFEQVSSIALLMCGLKPATFQYDENDKCYYAPMRQILEDGTRPRIKMIQVDVPENSKDEIEYAFDLYLGDWTDETKKVWKDKEFVKMLGYTKKGTWTF